MRHQLSFPCEGATLAATLDEAPGTTGLLIVSGGNEIRSGAHRGMATLAQRIAAAGHPVFRFDRRGIGDSEGENTGYTNSGPDIAAAIAAFRRAAPQLTRIIAFGNCDAASALGPVAGGFLTQEFGWRSVFMLQLPLSAVAAYFAFRPRGDLAAAQP